MVIGSLHRQQHGVTCHAYPPAVNSCLHGYIPTIAAPTKMCLVSVVLH